MGKAAWLFGGIFGGLGSIFALIGFGMIANDLMFASSAEETTGTVIRNITQSDSDGVSYKPVVEFRDSSGTRREFASSMSTSWIAYDQGETVDVLYDPDNPERASIDSTTERYILPGIFAAMGSLFAVIGGGVIVWRVRRIKTVARLFHQGERIDAEFTACTLDTSVKINGRSPYRVTVQARHPATGMLASFRSDPIWLDLGSELAGKNVPILIDPEDPDDYYVDLTEWVHESEFA